MGLGIHAPALGIWIPSVLWLMGASPFCSAQAGPHADEARPGGEDQVEERKPHTSEADLEAGRKTFLRRCAHCHGVRGEGGRGVNLTMGQYRLGDSDRQLFMTLRNGVPDSE